MTSEHRFLSQTSEWYTPSHVIEAAREFFKGRIHLDPASCGVANLTVRAALWADKQADGLSLDWSVYAARRGPEVGRLNVWLNPPYARGVTGKWVAKAIAETEACPRLRVLLLVNAVPGVSWFAPLLGYPILWFYERLAFISEDGVAQGSPTHGNALVLVEKYDPYDSRLWDFVDTFERKHSLGTVTVPYRYTES